MARLAKQCSGSCHIDSNSKLLQAVLNGCRCIINMKLVGRKGEIVWGGGGGYYQLLDGHGTNAVKIRKGKLLTYREVRVVVRW